MSFPIPDAALDDRLAILGTAGSGKTYLTTTAIERLLKTGRVVAVDPLGVMWGLRLKADGKTPSEFNLPIFGGKHGDLPLTENAGALIGETVATMRESCIVDLSELPTKSAERRFMTAFLEAIYRHTDATKVDPFHLIIDEADRFAPQKPPAGDETMLNRMEEIVRRGRVKGFIPWLITQRPAVLNKNVLSQADGLVLLKLTSSQDREQVGAWIEGQADRAQGKAILGSLPAMQRGQGVVWIPGRGILATVQFPRKSTFDSSSAPKRGEKRNTTSLKALDLGALKGRLAAVEIETKANDPATLKAEIGKLKLEIGKLTRQPASKPGGKTITPDHGAFDAAQRKGFDQGVAAARAGFRGAVLDAQSAIAFANDAARAALTKLGEVTHTHLRNLSKGIPAASVPAFTPAKASGLQKSPSQVKPVTSPRPATASAPVPDGLPTPHRRVMASLSFWASVGHEAPTREQVAGVAGYSPGSGGYNNILGALSTAGMIEKPQAGRVKLNGNAPPLEMSADEAKVKLLSILTGPEKKVIEAMASGEAMTRDEVADASGYSAGSGGFNNIIGHLNTLCVLTKPGTGTVQLSDWALEVLQ